MVEIWRPVKGYEGLYEVSNFGRVKSLSRDIRCGFGSIRHKREKIKLPKKDKAGYLVVQLYRNGKYKSKTVHKLVADAFIPNPNDFPCINHKDESKDNNYVFVNSNGVVDFEKSNLEWCTYKYNTNYGTALSRSSSKHKKKVAKYDIHGNILAVYDSIREASKASNVSENGISQCCSGNTKYKAPGGYIWKRIND